MASNNLFMPVWIDAYHADTQHLSTIQHGAYLLILMSMWRNGGKLLNDERRLATIAKMTLDKWRRYGQGIMDLLVVEDGMVTQKRLLQELEKSRSKIEKKRAAGKAGGEAKSLKAKGSKVADAVAKPVANDRQEGKQTSAIYSLLSTNEKKPSVSEGGAGEDPDAIFREAASTNDPDPKPEAKPKVVKDYAIDQAPIRLTYDDLERWQKLYTAINVAGEVTGMVGWLTEKAREGKNWFQVAQGALAKRDRDRRKEIETHRITAEANAKHGAAKAAAPRRMAI